MSQTLIYATLLSAWERGAQFISLTVQFKTPWSYRKCHSWYQFSHTSCWSFTLLSEVTWLISSLLFISVDLEISNKTQSLTAVDYHWRQNSMHPPRVQRSQWLQLINSMVIAWKQVNMYNIVTKRLHCNNQQCNSIALPRQFYHVGMCISCNQAREYLETVKQWGR